jgi:hypothetical protein
LKALEPTVSRKDWRNAAYQDLAGNPAGKEKSPTKGRLGIRNRTENIFHTFV